MNKTDFKLFLDKVPALRKTRVAVLTILYLLVGVVICILFFYYIDLFAWYMPLLTQFSMTIIVSIISYSHFKVVNKYRKKYQDRAYQPYFYRFMIPYLITWYACFFHPFFINGPVFLNFWLALIIGIFFLIMMFLTNSHIKRAGFIMMTHGMDLYTVFPEETTIVRGDIYSYIRHPLYLALTLGCIGLAFIANNLIALVASLLQIIPCIIAGKLEDKELIRRAGKEHEDYIKNTAMLFPFKKMFGFLKLLFLFR